MAAIASRVTGLLLDADVRRCDTASVRAAVRSLQDELRREAPGLRLHLVAHTEPYDRSVAHDVVIRLDDHVLVVGTAGGVDVPWPLRGVVRAGEQRLLRVNGQKLDVAGAMACLDFLFDDRQTLRTLVHSCLVAEALEEDPVVLHGEELQQAGDAFRRAKGLLTPEQTARWLADRALSSDQFAELVRRTASVAALRRRIAGDDAVRQHLRAHRRGYGTVVAAWVRGASGDVADDPLAAVLQARRAGRPAGIDEWRVRDLPDGLSVLADAPVGDPVPVEIDGAEGTGVVLDRREAVLDEATTAAIRHELFDAWLAGRRATADVEWHWGDAVRTGRVR